MTEYYTDIYTHISYEGCKTFENTWINASIRCFRALRFNAKNFNRLHFHLLFSDHMQQKLTIF